MFGGDQGGDGRGGPSGEKFPRGDHVGGWDEVFFGRWTWGDLPVKIDGQ